MDHQNGEPPGQNAIAGGSRVVARARPGAILAREPRGRENPMKRSLHGLIADGVVGGVLAGLVVALWFLAVDSLAGRPFHTPAALASALTRQEIGPPTLRLVTAYSVLHFGVFAVLGVAVAGAMAALRTPPRLLFGVLFGLVAQEVAFYAGLFLSDASRVAVVPWPHVVTANVLSAFVMAGALFVAIAEQIERTPALILIALMAMIVLDAVVGATLALGAQWVLGTLGVWSVLVGNVLAVCAMGWYVWATHPLLRRRLHEEVQVHV